MLGHTSLRASLAHAFQIPTALTTATTRLAFPSISQQQFAPFSTTPSFLKKKRGKGPVTDPKITLIRYFLFHPTRIIPRVLRLSRNRTLRHWTIKRAWSVFLARKRQQQQLELERQWNSMRSACEELRIGIGDGGRLYRQAMSKKGIWGGRSDLPMHEDSEGRVLAGEGGRVERGREAGIPIEYSRGLTDTPPRNGWDETWTR